MITLRAFNNSGKKFDLDLFQDETLKIDISAIESGDIGKVFGISSQQFALPTTKNNDNYFGRLWNLGATPSTSFIKTLPCQILFNGNAIFTGRIYLDSVITDQKGDNIYNVVIINETLDFKAQVENLTFGDLDWSEYDHDLTFNNITGSWDKQLFSGSIVYPLAEYGSGENDVLGNSLIESGGRLGTFTNRNTPMNLTQFKPAVQVITILDKIFESVGYEYTSSLFPSDATEDLYMLSTRDETKGPSFSSPVSQSFAYNTSESQTITPGVGGSPPRVVNNTVILEANDQRFNNGASYNTTNYTFTAVRTGDYSFNVGLNVELAKTTAPLEQLPKSVRINLLINNAIVAGLSGASFSLRGLSAGVDVDLTANFANIPLQAGDTVKVQVSFTPIVSVAGLEDLIINVSPQTYFKLTEGPATVAGINVSLNNIFDPDIKILDFLNGLIQKFNLVIEPLKFNANILKIETYDKWVDEGQIVDWTEKIDRSIKYEIRHPMVNEAREIIFSDEEDKDEFNQYTIDTFDKIYGDKKYISDSDLSEGERRIGTFFAPTPMRYIKGTNNFIVPQIYANKDNKKESITFKPRLLYYVGKKSSIPLINRNPSSLTGIFRRGQWYVRDEVGATNTLTQHPVFHHLSKLPADEGDTLDIHFNNLGHWSYHQNYVNAKTQRDAFFEYWAFYINELYDVESRLLTCNVFLLPDEIPKIELNNKIFIDGHYYRINRINGANLSRKDSVEVELIKTLPRKLKYPRRRTFISGDEFIDITLNIEPANIEPGIVNYVNYDTNLPVDPIGTNLIALNNASTKDDVDFREGIVSINKTPLSPPDNNYSTGLNYVDPRSHGSIILGSNNSIEGDSTDSFIIGEDNLVDGDSNRMFIFGDNIKITGSVENSFIVNTTSEPVSVFDASNFFAINPTKTITEEDTLEGSIILGNTKIQGAQFVDITEIEASAGNSYDLTGSNISNFLHFFEWSGSDGAFIANLPDAQEVKGISYKFALNGDFNNSRIIQVIPSGSQLINGEEGINLDNEYQTSTIYSVGNEWISFE